MLRIPVKDNTLGTILWMFPIDAEEAERYDGARFVVQSARKPPRKNPGGRGP